MVLVSLGRPAVGESALAGGSMQSAQTAHFTMPDLSLCEVGVHSVVAPHELCFHLCLPVAGGSQSVVLDAELVAVDRANGNKLRAFQELATRARSEVTEQQVGAETFCCRFVLEASSLKAAMPCDRHTLHDQRVSGCTRYVRMPRAVHTAWPLVRGSPHLHAIITPPKCQTPSICLLVSGIYLCLAKHPANASAGHTAACRSHSGLDVVSDLPGVLVASP